MWCLTSPGVVVHTICEDQSKNTFFDIGAFEGVIACDALSTHKAAARPKIQLAACWAHVHRRFAEAVPDHPARSVALLSSGIRASVMKREKFAQLSWA